MMGPRRERPPHADRRGFSLMEVGIAIAVFALLLGASLYLMVGTAHNARRTADLLTEGILAQVALRAVRDAVDSNPKWLEHLERYGFQRVTDGSLTCFGTPVAVHPPPVTPEGLLAPSPLMVTALAGWLQAGVPPAVARGLSEEDQARVRGELSRIAVRVTVRDHGKVQRLGSATYGAGALSELSKRVEIQVFTLSSAGQHGDWKPAYVITDELLTPNESLSTAALRELQASFDDAEMGSSIQDIRAELRSRPAYATYDDAALEISARIFLVFREANVEAYLTEGRLEIPGRTARDPYCLDAQIAELRTQSAPVLRKKLAKVLVKKAQLLVDAFRRMRTALEQLDALHRLFQSELATAGREMEASFLPRSRQQIDELLRLPPEPRFWALVREVGSLHQDYGAFLESRHRLLQKAMLFEYLVNDPKLVAAMARMRQYPSRFVECLAQASRELEQVAARTEATWQTRASATAQWVDVATALRVATASASPPERGAMAAPWATRFPLLADYVAQSDLGRTLPELATRNPGFTMVLPPFLGLSKPESPLEKLIATHAANGPAAELLDDAGRLTIDIHTAVLATGRSAGRLRLPEPKFRQSLELVMANLDRPLRLAVGLGLVSVEEVQRRTLPSIESRLKRQREEAGRKDLTLTAPEPGRSR